MSNTSSIYESVHTVIVLTKENCAEYLNAGTNALVDFSASWCGPCQRMKPMFEEEAKRMQTLATELKLDLKFLMVDVDEFDSLSSEYKIEAMPTIVVVKNGQEVFRNMGTMNNEKIRATIEKHFNVKIPINEQHKHVVSNVVSNMASVS